MSERKFFINQATKLSELSCLKEVTPRSFSMDDKSLLSHDIELIICYWVGSYQGVKPVEYRKNIQVKTQDERSIYRISSPYSIGEF
ncbi:MAG: hypothetical protein ACJAYA_000493 [Bacteroidia bacterium]|jgi:hypothetical protein